MMIKRLIKYCSENQNIPTKSMEFIGEKLQRITAGSPAELPIKQAIKKVVLI